MLCFAGGKRKEEISRGASSFFNFLQTTPGVTEGVPALVCFGVLPSSTKLECYFMLFIGL